MKEILVTTMVGLMTKEPRVVLEVPVLKVNLSPAEARDLAVNLFSAAESATVETMMVKLLTDELGQTVQSAGFVLAKFREMRKEFPNA